MKQQEQRGEAASSKSSIIKSMSEDCDDTQSEQSYRKDDEQSELEY